MENQYDEETKSQIINMKICGLQLSSIIEFTALESLSINDCNSIDILPQLPISIKKLYCYNCPSLRKIHPSFVTLDNLIDVFLIHCGISEDISPLFPKNVEMINISYNYISTLHKIPSSVTEIHVYNNSLKQIAFSTYSKLQYLYVDNNIELTINNILCPWKRLIEFSCQSTNIWSIPKKCSTLKKLSCGLNYNDAIYRSYNNNHIFVLPHAPYLRSIRAYGVSLQTNKKKYKTIESTISFQAYPNLQKIHLIATPRIVTSLDITNNTKLNHIHIKQGGIITIIGLYMCRYRLEIFTCNHNRLNTLSFCNFPKIQSINCSWNQLSEIQIVNCPYLQNVDMSYNLLTDVPSLIENKNPIICNVMGNRLQRIRHLPNHITELQIKLNILDKYYYENTAYTIEESVMIIAKFNKTYYTGKFSGRLEKKVLSIRLRKCKYFEELMQKALHPKRFEYWKEEE